MNNSKRQNTLKPVTKDSPCPHCGKDHWCYRLGELSVCNREAPPAPGWMATSKTDQEGKVFYAPSQPTQKAVRPKQFRTWIYRKRSGEPLVRVCREDLGDGRTPKRWQESWESVNSRGERPFARTSVTSSQPAGKWVSGTKGVKREDIPIYKYQEVKEAIAQGQTIFIVEGEPCADALWKLGLPATTNIGGSGKWKSSDSKDLVGSKVVLCPDRDKPGIKHTEAIASDFPDAQWLYAFPNSPFWYNLPASQGLDVADWIEQEKLTAADIWEAVEPRREGLPDPQIPTTPPIAQKNYIKMCLDALYADTPWIALGNHLYQWVGTHYQQADKATQIRRIADWCDTTPVQVGHTWKYALATPSHVDNIWKWLLRHFAVSPDQINPPGLNCLNGVVKINWNGRHASWELVPHHPQVLYTYVSEIKFDPDADKSDCDRMLSCLEPNQQKLFIQTMAASLDLATIRKYRGRKVKALLCKGHGNNGKDTLREAVSRLYGGIGLSDASISDFAAYDRGRKFDLAKLQGARINWSSENSSFETLDRLQSLKKAITGETLDCERKGVDSRSMELATVFLFNVNEAPNLKAGTEAIQSRWAVLEFNKTYKDGADPAKGEIEADSRFRYDPDFLKEKVCPALLNKMLEALATLAIDGIDYQCTSEALSHIQQETNHLWALARDVGLDYLPNGRIYINDLWERLQEWYIDNGTLEIVTTDSGKEKKIWHDQPRRGDKNVKAPNQVYQRFAELFPKIKKQRDNCYQSPHRGQFYLAGIGIHPSEAVSEAVSEATSEAVSLTPSGIEASEAIGTTSALNAAEILRLISTLSPQEQADLKSALKTEEEENKLTTDIPQTASLASMADPESVTASPIASPTASHIASVEQPTAPTEEPTETETVISPDATNPEFDISPTGESSEQVDKNLTPNSDTNCPIIDWNELLEAMDREMKRLCWRVTDGRAYLQHKYHQKSRQALTDEEALEFYHFLTNRKTGYLVGERVVVSHADPCLDGQLAKVLSVKPNNILEIELADHRQICEVSALHVTLALGGGL